MTKTKMSTVAIVVLSVLLAAALAATIVLAAFSFTGSATTTLTFGSGIQLEVTGVSGSAWNAHMITANAEGTSGTISSEKAKSTENLSSGVSLSNITVKNTSTTNVVVAVGYKIEQAGTALAPVYVDNTTTATATEGNKHTAGSAFAGEGAASTTITGLGASWKTFKMGASAASAETVLNYIHSAINSNDLTAGAGFKGTVYIIAVVDDASATTNINAAITAGNFAAFAA